MNKDPPHPHATTPCCGWTITHTILNGTLSNPIRMGGKLAWK